MTIRPNRFIIRTAEEPLQLMAAELLAALTAKFKREDIYASCLTCRNFEDKSIKVANPAVDSSQKFYCKKYQGYPPIEILINACEGYDDNDDITF